MNVGLIQRAAEGTLTRISAGFPILWLTGPRQSGKTTLARQFRPDLPYVNLERPDEREFARVDPRGFLSSFPHGAVLDEVQHVPELLSWLQADVDEHEQMGRWLLTGSQQPAIAQGVSQSLAGRVGRVELLPLSGAELADADLLPRSLDEVLFSGGYPALFRRDVSPTDWLANYTATYIERDVRALSAVRDLSTFTRFVRLCAARSGQIVNLSSLGSDAGISTTAVRQWLSILRATYIVELVEPHHANVTTRLVKSPKLLFTDVGLMAYLIGITSADQICVHPLRGALFETWGITEQIKAWRNAGSSQQALFVRDKHGLEIDLVYPMADRWQGVEFKSGATIASDWSRSARLWESRNPREWSKPVIVYGGDQSSRRTDVDFRAWRDYAEGLR